MPDDDGRSIREGDRVWRIEQRHKDLVERFQGLEKSLAEARYKADQAYLASQILRDRVDMISAGRDGGQKSVLQDSAFVRGIIAVLITAMLAFATGRFFNIGG